MAENGKNLDRFSKIYKVKTLASNVSRDFTGVVGTGPGSIIDISDTPMVTWTIQVKGTLVAATLWSVILEVSLDGVNFSEALNHTSLTGDGVNLYSGTTLFLAKYFRINVAALTLGPATSITVSVLGKQ